MSDTAPPNVMEALLWRQLDGEALAPEEVAALEAALASDPALAAQAVLQEECHRTLRAAGDLTAPAGFSERLKAALDAEIHGESPAADAKIVAVAPKRWYRSFSMVASLLLILVVGGVLAQKAGMIGAQPTHEQAMILRHVASARVPAEFTESPDARVENGMLELEDFQIPQTQINYLGSRLCSIIDCPSRQYYGLLPDGTPLSYYVVYGAKHFNLPEPVPTEIPTHRDYRIIAGRHANMVAWTGGTKVYGVVADLPPNQLIEFAEQAPPVQTVASLPRDLLAGDQ